MSDLTDLEIIKRIAEIVGCQHDDSGLVMAYGQWINPLLDVMRAKAWCFDLMIEYSVWRWSNPGNDWFTATIKGKQGFTEANTLNKAILLAIIEANKK